MSKEYKFDPNTKQVTIFAPFGAVRDATVDKLEAIGYKLSPGTPSYSKCDYLDLQVSWQGSLIYRTSKAWGWADTATIEDVWNGRIAPCAYEKAPPSEDMRDIDGKEVSVSTIKVALAAYFKEGE